MREGARTLLGGAAALGFAAGILLGLAPPAAAAAECSSTSSDFDRDGTGDEVVGSPGGPGRPGSVQVRLSNDGHPVTATLTGAPGFGTAVTALSSTSGVDPELCSQLVVGSPDESDRTDLRGSGAIHVYYLHDGHLVRRGSFHPQAQGVGGTEQSGARFGAAVAAEPVATGTGSPRQRLYVGAPGFDVADGGETVGARDAGRVTSFRISDDEDPLAYDTETLDYGDDLTPGQPSRGGRLGASLSAAGGLVAIGAPGQRDRGVAGAGTVLVAPVDGGPDDSVTQLSQATPGVPGTPERGDRFGAAVHLLAHEVGSPTLVVGAPGEDRGRIVDAGAVTVARVSRSTGAPLGRVRVYDQDSPGIAGAVEAGDAFGAAVSSVRYAGRMVLLVGSPGEDVGRERDAGMVSTVGAGRGWTQDSRGVPGRAETGDRTGASLGATVVAGAPQALVGVPGEDGGTGAVLVGLPGDGPSVSYRKGATAGSRFGFSVGP